MPDIYFGGGLNERDDFNIDIEECSEGQNFLLDGRARTFRPRKPFGLFGTVPNGAPISGIMQLIKRDDVDTLLASAGNTVYQIADTGSSAGVVGTINTSTGMRSSYWSLDDKIVITDIGWANVIHQWNGSTFRKNKHGIGNGTVQTSAGITRSGSVATLTLTAHGISANDLVTISGADQSEYNGEVLVDTATTDTFSYTVSGTPTTPATGTITIEKSVDLYAKYSVVHNGRVWLANIKTDTDENPHVILASFYEDPDNFDNSTRAGTQTASGLTGNEAFFLVTPDGRPINGIIKFYNTLIFSTKDGELFRLSGSSAADYQIIPFYPESEAIGTETLLNIGNDVAYMKKGPSIDLVSSTERFGDVSADDLSRYIPDQIAGISDAITVYNQKLQQAYFFVNNKVLVLDKNMMVEQPNRSPWSVYKTNHPSNFNTLAATYIRIPNSSDYDVYWGDSTGNIHKMTGTAGGGDGGVYDLLTYRKTRTIRETPSLFENQLCRVEYRRRGACQLIMTLTYNESGVNSSCNVNLRDTVVSGTPGFWNGDIYWGEDVYWNDGAVVEDVISKQGFSPAGKGEGFFVEARLTTSVDFLINRIIIPPDDTQR